MINPDRDQVFTDDSSHRPTVYQFVFSGKSIRRGKGNKDQFPKLTCCALILFTCQRKDRMSTSMNIVKIYCIQTGVRKDELVSCAGLVCSNA